MVVVSPSCSLRGGRLPAGLLGSRNHAIEAKIPEANATHLELSIDSPRTPTELATMFLATTELGSSVRLCNFWFTRHAV